MKTTLLTNVVYPLYKHGENVVHFTPGKRWDSFYTWDSGIIGVGVLEYSIEKSQYILETYLAEEDNEELCFCASRKPCSDPVCTVWRAA